MGQMIKTFTSYLEERVVVLHLSEYLLYRVDKCMFKLAITFVPKFVSVAATSMASTLEQVKKHLVLFFKIWPDLTLHSTKVSYYNRIYKQLIILPIKYNGCCS